MDAKLAPLFQPMKSKIKTSCDSALVFPSLANTACICQEFWLVYRTVCNVLFVIGKINCFGFDLTTTLILRLLFHNYSEISPNFKDFQARAVSVHDLLIIKSHLSFHRKIRFADFVGSTLLNKIDLQWKQQAIKKINEMNFDSKR